MQREKDLAAILIRYLLIPTCLFVFAVFVTDRLLRLESIHFYTDNNEKLTVRINTYKRLDLLEGFLEYYKLCPVIEQTQVVWSDQEETPPLAWLNKYPNVIFEQHKTNSLNNRFRPLQPLPTEAILSIDDDLIIPCDNLKSAHWSASQLA